MTLYLRVTVGETDYLVAASRIAEVQPAIERAELHGEHADLSMIDCRRLFGTPETGPGNRVAFRQDTGLSAAVLIVDQLHGLVEIDDDVFRKLPPIGPLSALIDAVSTRHDEPPALRLRVDPALLAQVLSLEPIDG